MNSRQLPLVTIITSVLNGDNTLEETFQSVFNQTYPNIEYIVVDGGSTDNTLGLIRKYEDNISYWVSEPDTGIYNAWNKGIKLAEGDWFLFLGSDDILEERGIEMLIEKVRSSNQTLDYVSAKSIVFNDKGKYKITGEPWSWSNFRRYVCTAQCGAIHSKRLYEEVGLYDESFKIAGDYELLLRKGDALKTAFVDKENIRFRLGGVSNGSLKAIKETNRAIQMHSDESPLTIELRYYYTILSWFWRTFFL